MKFPSPLIPATLRRRYKRFLSDVTFEDGTTVTAHCPNSGSMLGLSDPGLKVWVSHSDSKTRKHAHTLELIELPDGNLAGVNTGRPNAIVAEGIEARRIAPLSGYSALRREVRYGRNSRIDILLQADGRPDCYVEVKNVHLVREAGLAEFPDSVTSRGAKHLVELGDMVDEGHRAVMVFLVHRTGTDRFGLAADIDPAYAAAFKTARGRGVEAVALSADITPEEVIIGGELPITGQGEAP